MKDSNGFVGFWRKVAIVGSGVTVAAAIIGVETSFAWKVATEPIITAIKEERVARVSADSSIAMTLRLVADNRMTILALLDAPVNDPGRINALRRLRSALRER